MNSSSTPSVKGGPAPKRWSRTLGAPRDPAPSAPRSSGLPDHRLDLDLDAPAGIEQRGHDGGRGRTRRAERLQVRAADGRDVGGVGQEDAATHDVGEARAGLGEGGGDDREAEASLLVGLRRRLGVSGHDRGGAGDPDLPSDPDGARVADPVLEGGSGRDALAIHPVVSRLWSPWGKSRGGRARTPRSRSSPRTGWRRSTATRRVPTGGPR